MRKWKYLVTISGALAAATLTACGDDDSNGGTPDAAPLPADAGPEATATLVGRAILPAATFADGPATGQYLGTEAINGQTPPFDKPPVQGFSDLARVDDNTFLALSDNGFGTLENSADYPLRVYRIKPDLAPPGGGSGSIEVESFIELSDPNQLVPFTITNHHTPQRLLTGADFDPESLEVAPDGTLWLGDEFGPFLLHFSPDGVLIDPPFQLPDFANEGRFIRSPQNPLNEEAAAVRVMNAVRAHALAHGNTRTPVFSPYNAMLKYEGSGLSVDRFRGDNVLPPGLAPAAGDVFDIPSIQAAGYPIVTWTVNDKARMLELLAKGVNGIISDRPDLLYEALTEFDANGDSTPGDYLTPDGLVDTSRFDAQGHRGARNLRPENTLPAMEAALDHLMSTLETDSGMTSDGVLVLNHDPYIEPQKCRHADGTPFTEAVLIKNLTLVEIQSTFICDNLFRGPSQTNDRDLSPVTKAFAEDNGLADAYTMPTVAQMFDFVSFYIQYYRDGVGKDEPAAAKRVANAERVRFNIETKLNPRSDLDRHGNVFKDRTAPPEIFADTLAELIIARQLAERADIQSFDFHTLIRVQEKYPAIRTVYLFGDFPLLSSPEYTDDGTNLQDENGANTPWLVGMFWPYRVTVKTQPFRAGRSGGFEGMALSADGKRLLPLLEKPLDGQGSELLIHEFDLETKTFTGVQHRYALDKPEHAIGDFIMVDAQTGLVIERDSTQGDINGFKTIQRITLKGNGELVDKALLVNLNKLADPMGIAPAVQGDVGVGGGSFAFPFETIEGMVLLGDNRLGVVNDNNFPFGLGRHTQAKLPDDTELIVIELDAPLTDTP